jgi:hypothetical protein
MLPVVYIRGTLSLKGEMESLAVERNMNQVQDLVRFRYVMGCISSI